MCNLDLLHKNPVLPNQQCCHSTRKCRMSYIKSNVMQLDFAALFITRNILRIINFSTFCTMIIQNLVLTSRYVI